MSTKYSISATARWANKRGVRFSDHALQRWDERTHSDSVSPETAFDRARAANEMAGYFDSISDGDCERVYCYQTRSGETMVMLARNGVIVTVLELKMVKDAATRSYLNVRGQEAGE